MADVKLNIITNFSDAVKGTKDLTNSMDNLNKETEQYNENVKKSMNSAIAGSNKASQSFTRAGRSIEDLEDRLKDLNVQMKKVTDPKELAKYNREIQKVKTTMQTMKKQGVSSMQAVNRQATVGINTFKKLAGAIGLAFSVSTITNFIKEATRAYDLQIKAETSLKVALKGRLGVLNQLKRQAKELQKVTRISDQEILEQQALAASIGLTGEEIEKLIPAALDLSAATGKSLNFAVLNLLRTYSGLAGELGELIPDLKNFTREELQAGAAVEYATKQFKGQAEAIGALDAADIDKLSNAWTNFKENVGGTWLRVAGFNFKVLAWALGEVNDAIDKLFNDVDPLADLPLDEARKKYEMYLVSLSDLEKKLASETNTFRKTALEVDINRTKKYIDDLEKLYGFGQEQIKKTQKETLDEMLERLRETHKKELDEIRERARLEAYIKKSFKDVESDADAILTEIEKDNDKEVADNAKKLEEQRLKEFKTKLTEAEQFAKDHPLAIAFGIESEKELQALQDFASAIKSSVDSITQAWVENTERVVDTLNTRIAEQQRAIEIEAQLAEAGKANSLSLEKSKLQELQKARERALKDQEKALKAQRAIESASQAISLTSAIANILRDYTTIPFVGLALATAAITGMLQLFKSQKSNIGELTQYAEGGEIKGRSHAQGGVKVPGMGIELEGGEYVINKKAYAKYPDLVEAINRDNFRVKHDHLDVKVADQNVSLRETKEIKEIRDLLREMRNQPRVEYYDGYRIETFGNVRRRIG